VIRRRVRVRLVACAISGLIAVPVLAGPAQAKSGISITAVLTATGRAGAGQVAVSAFGGDDAAGRQRLCVQRLVGDGAWRTVVCGPVEFGTGGRVRASVPSSVTGPTWVRALLQAVGRGPRRRPVTVLVSAPVAPVLTAPCRGPQWQSTSRSAVSLSSVDNGIATASVVRSK
jgi:hypothetical protein